MELEPFRHLNLGVGSEPAPSTNCQTPVGSKPHRTGASLRYEE